MKIALLTHYVPTEKEDYSRLAALTVPNRDEWCKRHGYRHVVQRGPYKRPDWYYAFDRLLLLRDLLDSENAPDFVWTLNVQAVITNIGIGLDAVLDPEHDFWITKDVHGINMGSFIVRNTSWTKSWLDFIISLEQKYHNDPWKEQRAVMDWWLHENWTWKICLLPHSSINSYFYSLYPPWPLETPGNWRYGDFVVSLPGLSLEQRIEIIKKIYADSLIVK